MQRYTTAHTNHTHTQRWLLICCQPAAEELCLCVQSVRYTALAAGDNLTAARACDLLQRLHERCTSSSSGSSSVLVRADSATALNKQQQHIITTTATVIH
jgi:hypothetical protein